MVTAPHRGRDNEWYQLESAMGFLDVRTRRDAMVICARPREVIYPSYLPCKPRSKVLAPTYTRNPGPPKITLNRMTRLPREMTTGGS